MPSRSSRIVLPPGLVIAQVADACRYGALAYLNGVLAEWGKRELGAWLCGTYAGLTRHSIAWPAPPEVTGLARVLPTYAVNRVMREAHDEVLDRLRTLRNPEGAAMFVFDSLGGLVERCEDAHGDAGWLPIASARMRLADRVLSLVAADHLTRPEDYETGLSVCATCRVVSFDAAARARGLCRVHSASGICFRDSQLPRHASEPAAFSLANLAKR